MESDDLRGPRGAPVLEARNVRRVFHRRGPAKGETIANDSLDLTVHAGEVVALLGPNGAGKSTFLRQVAGQLIPTSGTIVVAGIDIVARPVEAKQYLSVIPQECEPAQELTPTEQVRYFGEIKGIPRAELASRVETILRDVGLWEYRNQIVRELSGGLKRRVLIAIAMAAGSPKLLLLDEPTTGLDPEARRQVWALIRALRRKGLGILLTTHYIEEAELLADLVVVIQGGKFVVRGSVDEIRRRLPYRGRLTVAHIDRLRPEAAAAVLALESRWTVSVREPTEVWFEVPDPFDQGTVDTLAQLTKLGAMATLRPASLEDAYLAVVGQEAGRA
jgi:ABC-2 type transport system ATP-binding protein